MKKNAIESASHNYAGYSLKQFLLVMKLTTLLLIITLVQVSASGFGQKISLNEKNTPIKEVIQTIEKQSGYTFFYDTRDLPKVRVTISLKNASIDEALKEIFKDIPLTTYKIVKNNVVITKVIAKAEPIILKEVKPEVNNVIEVAPPIYVTGSVIDAKTGESIVGVTVKIEGTTNGVITDVNGKFALKIPKPNVVLVFTCVGYDVQRVVLKGQLVLNIRLIPSLSKLGEVVVVGYGIQKKVSVTGAVTSVPIQLMKQSSVPSLANALAGRLPGLTSIQSGGGQPGFDDATMYLRGAATLNGRSPLILIDGVTRDNIRTIDPNEVASISILKDASATAIFGVRGANGVILITTRRGVEGKPELTIDAVQSYSSFTREPERLHSLEYMKLRNEASANDNISPLPFSQAMMDQYKNPLAGLDPKDPDYATKAKTLNYMYPDHDYYRELIKRFSPQTRVNMNVSGGTDKVSYFVNTSYLHQGGNLNTESKSVLGYDPAYKMDRFNFRANLDYKVTKSLKAFLNIGSYIEQVNMPSTYQHNNDINFMNTLIFVQAQSILPITPGPTTIAGFGVAPGQIVDPGYQQNGITFDMINRQGYQNEVRTNLNSSFGLDWDLSNTITKGLSVKGMISYDTKAITDLQGNKSERKYLAVVNNGVLSYSIENPNETLISMVKSANSRYNINMQGFINYNRTFGAKHDVSGMILAQRDNWESTIGEIPYNVVSFSSRFTYGYDNRYLAEVDMGYNGSEQFAPSKRYGFFPAVSGGWIVSNEDFLKNNPVITNLKLRASYGKVGNDQIGGARFLYQSNITLANNGVIPSLGLGQTINQGLLGNPDISWEVSRKQNYGMDLQLFKDLNASFDYFVEHRSNILISRGTIPEFQGVPLANLPKVNIGKVDNSGYELELTYNKSLSKDFFLMVKGSYSYNHNIVKFCDEPIRDSTYTYRYRSTGYPINQNWGYKIDYSNGNGYFNSQKELDDYLAKTKYAFGSPRVGDFKYIDLNGDGIVDDKDQAPIGYSNIPRVTYGITLSLHYKSFDFSTFFEGVGKYSGVYQDNNVYEYIGKGTYYDYQRTAWTAERYANGEKITYPALSTSQTTNHVSNSFFIMDRSYIRLKNIELSYTFSAGALKKAGINKLRVFVGADNLFTWDHMRMGNVDPENNDATGYPVTKMENFGVNITF